MHFATRVAIFISVRSWCFTAALRYLFDDPCMLQLVGQLCWRKIQSQPLKRYASSPCQSVSFFAISTEKILWYSRKGLDLVLQHQYFRCRAYIMLKLKDLNKYYVWTHNSPQIFLLKVSEVHSRFTEAMQELFERHKKRVGYEDLPLRVV